MRQAREMTVHDADHWQLNKVFAGLKSFKAGCGKLPLRKGAAL